MTLRWVKQQDFCLRLGLLKILVAILPTSRTSSARSSVLRRLTTTLFALPSDPVLLQEARNARRDPEYSPTSRVEALLLASGAESWGQPIRKSTTYKLLEWGHTVGLVVKGNRISERGLMLRTLFDREGVEAFLDGGNDWNPFRLTPEERSFFFYHLGEGDELLWRLAFAAGQRGRGTVLEARDNSLYELTVDCLEDLVEDATGHVSMTDLSRFRTLRELTETIAWEVRPESRDRKPRAAYGPPSSTRPIPTLRSGSKQKPRKKNADHQAIPRFEQLVDVTLLEKPVEGALTGAGLDRAKRAWRFSVSAGAEAFAMSVGESSKITEPRWRWTGFAQGCGPAGIGGPATTTVCASDEAVDYFVEAYDRIRRPAGHTPFESIAVLAMILALRRGRVLEVDFLHRIVMWLKRTGTLGDQIFFAAGNEVDRMFLVVKPNFQEAWLQGSIGDRFDAEGTVL